MTREIWKTVPGFPMYDISDRGRIRSRHINAPARKHSELLRQGTGWSNAVNVLVDDKGNHHTFMISTLVMLAFVGKKPPQHYIAYRDGNRHNCRLENIYYAPNQERWNAVSKKRKEKSKSFKRKVNRKQYNLIFKSIVARYVRLVQSGTMTQAQAASKLGIHYSTMSRYCSGQTPLFNKRFHTFFTLGIDTYP